MNELLQKLLEAEILSEDTKKELEEAFTVKIEEVVTEAKNNTEADVKAKLTEEWIIERESLVEAVDVKVNQFLEDELTELKEDISRFRDLEAEYAEKLVEAKAQMRDEVKDDITNLVEKLDAFLEIRLVSEMEELRSDITEQRKNNFGRKMFEAMVDEYRDNFSDDDDAAATLAETSQRLQETQESLVEYEEKVANIERKVKMTNVLSALDGRPREVMEAILKNVATSQLEEGYNTFIGRVLKEEENKDVITESEGNKDKEVITEQKNIKIISGDVDKTTIIENDDSKSEPLSESALANLRKLAGI